METYNGHVRTPADAIILFEACRIGLLPRVQRRLSEKERQSIKSGSVFVWDEREAGMRRWTDGKSWSASRVSGSFLTYREMEGKRGGTAFDKNANRDGVQGNEQDSDGGGIDGYRYKLDGLMKQSFSITTNSGQHLHLISYFSRNSTAAINSLMQPTNDPQLRHIRPEKGMYPESTVHEQSNIPAVTRGPMSSPGYTHSPHQAPPYARNYGPYPPHWAPPSPMHTPPPYGYSGYPPHPQHAPYPAHSPLQHMQYAPHPSYGPHPPPPTAFDRAPPPLPNNGLPPPSHPYGAYGPGYGHGHSNSYGGYPQYPPPPPPQHSHSYPPPHPQHQQSYDSSRPSNASQHSTEPVPDMRKEDRQDSHQSLQSQKEPSPQHGHANISAAPSIEQSATSQPPTSGQTIPSISSMLNGGATAPPPRRPNSRSPNGTHRGPITDIPSHKLGFEVNRDVQALRNLDKTTFKGY